ncbi:MAG: hypothetical protein KC621_22965, partial [Myxococcales bacterium]|nr:hypothetical protein [Myxococcales bacterium]
AESLVAAGKVALAEGNTLLAGADGAVALRYADLPEARGLVARMLAAGTPHPLEQLDAGHPCRWLVRSGESVVCGGDGVTAFVGGERRWHRDERTVDGALSADGGRLAVTLSTPDGGSVEELSMADGTSARTIRAQSDAPRAVAWAAGRPVWAEAGLLVDGERRVWFCNSSVTDLRVDASGLLHAVCANGGYGRFRPDDLSRVDDPATPQRGVAFVVTPDGDGAWMGMDRSVRRVGIDAGDTPPVDVGGYPGSLAVSPDGHWLVASTDRGQVRWVDLADGGPPTVLPSGATRTGLAFEPDGTLWVSGTRGPVRWSPPATPAVERGSGVTSIVPAGDDAVLVTRDGVVERMQVAGPDRRKLLDVGHRRHLYRIGADAWVADTQFHEAWRISEDGTVEEQPSADLELGRLGGIVGDALAWWVPGTDEVVMTGPNLDERVRAEVPRVAIVDGRLLTRQPDGFSELSPTTLQPIGHVAVDRDVLSPPLSPDWDVVGHGDDGTWWLRERDGVVALRPDGTAQRVEQPLISMAMLAGGRIALGAWDGTWSIVDDGRSIAVLPGGGARVSEAWLVGDRLVTTDWDGHARTWDPAAFDADGADLWQRVLPDTGYDWVDGRIVSR